MKIKIDQAQKLSNLYLIGLGFSWGDASLITKNLVDAELVEKKSHGLIRLPAIKKKVEELQISIDPLPITIMKQTPTALHFDAKLKPGFVAIYQSLDYAIEKIKNTGMVSVGVKDMGYASGYIGSYARIATENNLIFIGFNNSPGGLIPYGAKKDLWGTNPLTIAVPSAQDPVILDMASSITTWGNLLVSKQEGKILKNGVALDSEGRPTRDPIKAMEGGILAFGGHKGSGLAFMVELLAGALTGSRVGNVVEGGWGSFFILIDPSVFGSLEDFKEKISKAIDELKNAPKIEGVSEIFYAGEKSNKRRKVNLEIGEIELDDSLLAELNSK